MADEATFQGWINPLSFIEAELPAGQLEAPDEASVLQFACTPGVPSDVPSILDRYRDISATGQTIFVAPAEQRILDKLIWPLRNAKASFALGNYLGTISLCGMVGEMVAILLFDLASPHVNSQAISDKEARSLFGREFEKLGQDRRIQVLEVLGVIDREAAIDLELIRGTRNRYLHLWSQDHDRLPIDARAAFAAGLRRVGKLIGTDIRDGKVALNPALDRYLTGKRHE